ncbi:DUF2783 domain-containing protein [Paraburkholderia sp. MMS20-SJTR3]|uniref:DUF2783 domain-containing protein n=1 Tax=Paraburkholderia sejongensis TaxID=2886946 RepID=A0ABS8JXS5_9BURK|nr:DUF2783 domain-containing protein [Paraburkholderia sp. MMS20-SJTR3]MCC8394545.1 DUF2783 domain-containing protein [Paraburkholderia sp. MMS20-SJTR3]
MSHLNLEPNIADMDAFYEHLIDTHNGLSDADSHALNAKLVLLLANHVGDIDVIREALAKARTGLGGGAQAADGSSAPNAIAQSVPVQETV